MKVFISWSGAVSHQLAAELSDWLPLVLNDIQPFLSSEDIQKGGRWFDEIGAQLESTDFGILCLTPGNVNAPWILFEAGALSKKVEKGNVVPLLACMKPTDLFPPLSNFNATVLTKEDVYKLVKTMNALQGEKSYGDTVLGKRFDKWWSELEHVINAAEKQIREGAEGGKAKPKREVADMMEEVLELTRQLVSNQHGAATDRLTAALAGARAAALDLRREHGALGEGGSELFRLAGLGPGSPGGLSDPPLPLMELLKKKKEEPPKE